ncbi:MAG TPA: hypothetical protein DDZ88_20115 [Verrucomicrobiales bacterium]|nr:hypothetical protein [Verrucomicrobiales bacterium]
MSTTLEQIQYGFDRDSRRTWQRRSLTDTQDRHYNYDALSQVSAAARGSLNLNATAISGIPASAESWDYDPTGNWRGYHTAVNGTPTLDQHRVHDRGNRMTQIEDNPNNMILDRVGRMRQMAPDAEGDWDGKLELTWDAWSRITRVKNNGTVVGEYTYDGTHRRVTREVVGETLHSYFNSQWRPVEERRDAETTAAMSYLWGARHRDDLVRRDRAVGGTSLNETRYVLMDYFNPATITDQSGVVKERYAFSAFGVRTILNPDFTVRSDSECGMEFGFQGQFLDQESGLLNYGYRYYSPQLGRWLSKDPIGEEGGVNLYVMAGDNALNQVDHVGLYSFVNDTPGGHLAPYLFPAYVDPPSRFPDSVWEAVEKSPEFQEYLGDLEVLSKNQAIWFEKRIAKGVGSEFHIHVQNSPNMNFLQRLHAGTIAGGIDVKIAKGHEVVIDCKFKPLATCKCVATTRLPVHLFDHYGFGGYGGDPSGNFGNTALKYILTIPSLFGGVPGGKDYDIRDFRFIDWSYQFDV